MMSSFLATKTHLCPAMTATHADDYAMHSKVPGSARLYCVGICIYLLETKEKQRPKKKQYNHIEAVKVRGDENPASGASLTILTKPIAPFAVALQPVTQIAAAEDPGLPLQLPIQVGSASANLHYYISIVPIPTNSTEPMVNDGGLLDQPPSYPQ